MDDNTVLDVFGTPITIGAKVIYNLSGNLAYGEVIRTHKVARTTRYTTGIRYNYSIKIRLLRETESWYSEDHISNVRNPAGIVVVRDDCMKG